MKHNKIQGFAPSCLNNFHFILVFLFHFQFHSFRLISIFYKTFFKLWLITPFQVPEKFWNNNKSRKISSAHVYCIPIYYHSTLVRDCTLSFLLLHLRFKWNFPKFRSQSCMQPSTALVFNIVRYMTRIWSVKFTDIFHFIFRKHSVNVNLYSTQENTSFHTV